MSDRGQFVARTAHLGGEAASINYRGGNDYEYRELERSIDACEGDAIRCRWRFGQMMLAERQGKGRLPNGRMEALIRLTGKSKAELSFRAQFAEVYPTETELSTVVDSFKSWTAIRDSLSPDKEKAYAGKSEGDTNIWLTPPDLVRRLGVFDLDPCAAPNPKPFVHALDNWSLEEKDGLKEDWSGRRVFVNPPYGKETAKWIEKLSKHGNGVLLVFDNAATEYWHKFVWPKASAVLFLRGHIKFHFPDGRQSTMGAAFPSALIAYGTENEKALRNCGLSGSFVQLPAKRLNGVQASSL